nr:hypothetical protein BdHM001_18590 [Bdellovibrio sp. HM001]
MSLKPCCEKFLLEMESAPQPPVPCPDCGASLIYDRIPKQYRKEIEGEFREDWDSQGYAPTNPRYNESE